MIVSVKQFIVTVLLAFVSAEEFYQPAADSDYIPEDNVGADILACIHLLRTLIVIQLRPGERPPCLPVRLHRQRRRILQRFRSPGEKRRQRSDRLLPRSSA